MLSLRILLQSIELWTYFYASCMGIPLCELVLPERKPGTFFRVRNFASMQLGLVDVSALYAFGGVHGGTPKSMGYKEKSH